jgi:hypothetical protein
MGRRSAASAGGDRHGTFRRWVGWWSALLLSLWPLSGAAAADRPVAVVEDVSGSRDVRVMEYLYEGRRLSLKPDEGLVIGYLGSCLVETITGGEVTIGAERSRVDRGAVSRHKIACDAEKLLLTDAQSDAGGAMVYRNAPDKLAEPSGRIYGLSPALSVPAPGLVRLQRLDQPAPVIELEMTGLEADLSTNGVQLAPKGLYRVTIDARALVFRVDAGAKEHAPLISRLLRL